MSPPSTALMPDTAWSGTALACEAAEITVGAAPQAVAWARHWVLRQVRLLAGADVASTAELLVSELVTNAVCHSGSEDVITVRIHPFDTTIVVAVHDGGSTLPVLDEPAPGALHGRGLPLVDHLAVEWGADAAPEGGKAVWFRLDL